MQYNPSDLPQNEAKEPYVPTPEELVGESFAYCYSDNSVILPPEVKDAPAT